MSTKIVAYVRVSTARQGASGLGLEAQQAAIEAYAKQTGGTVIWQYTEVESGKRSDRPEIAKAISHAKRSKAILVVAKLDRLARNVAFLSKLMETSWTLWRVIKRILTKRCPAWLAVQHGKFSPIPEAVQTINMLFAMKVAGNGIRTIEQRLNAEACWTPPKSERRKSTGWRSSYIKKILSNRAVLGEYQPHERTSGQRVPVGDVVTDYYPRIVEPKLFHAVRGA